MTTNLYTDTRGRSGDPIPFTRAVINGLAEGGGLYVPQTIPHMTLDQIVALAQMPYAQRAATVYRLFGIDLPDQTINALMKQAYGDNFDTSDICPITTLDDNTHMLELWHGPTSAFKDMALQCLPLFFEASAQQLRQQGAISHDFLILVATSGDTGKAALEGFKDKQGIRIGVMYPHGGVSDIQYRQMATQEGSNVMVWSVEGNFDDCQTGAKRVFGDQAFASTLMDNAHVALSSANSINWGRLLPQVVYYLSAYAVMVRDGKIAAGDPIDVCVPTGNFGNILAAWYARSIGAPIERLLCASNENRVLTDFINTGTYDITNRDFILTPSPSMDILVSSNLERQLFELTGRNANAISSWMDNLNNAGQFRVDPATFKALRSTFAADSVDGATCLQTIKRVYDSFGYVLDPHTAVAYEVGERLRGNNPLLIASTAHWAKFGRNVYRGLHGIAPHDPLPSNISSLSDCEINRTIAKETDTSVPVNLSALEDKPIRFNTCIKGSQTDIEQAVMTFIEDE